MEKLNLNISKIEKDVIKSCLDYNECQKIRKVFYGIIESFIYLQKANILENMFNKYDSFLDKNEAIYRGIRIKNKDEFEIFIETYKEALSNNGLIIIDKAPSSFSRKKKIAYEEFALSKSNEFYSIVFKLIKRKEGELYIKDFAGQFVYQEEIILKSHKSKFKIMRVFEK